MRIKKLSINNYRCFKNYEITLAPHVNVIIGRNGAGKTTLINALHKALSFIFANAKTLGNDFLSSGNPSLKVSSFETGDYHFDTESRTVASSADIRSEAEYNGHELVWDMYKRATSGAALYSSKYKEAFAIFTNAWKNEGADLPLLAYYSDSYPHKNLKETKFALETVDNDVIPRNFGYYQWNVEGACTSLWEYRLCNKLAERLPYYTICSRNASDIMGMEEEMSPEELKVNEKYIKLKRERERINSITAPLFDEIDYIEDKLRKFVSQLPSLDDEGYGIDYFMASPKDNGYELEIRFKNGRKELFRDLPAGYRRLYSIVFDMAYRAYILNGNSEPSGIVMIDEVDLHLHPSLEQCVVTALRNTFEKVQFVLTTHSPAVISNLKTTEEEEAMNKILFMQEGQSEAETLPNIYGLDYNSALRDFMETPSRNSDVHNLKNEYLVYCSLGMEKDAKITLDKLKVLLGREDHPLLKVLEEKGGNNEIR